MFKQTKDSLYKIFGIVSALFVIATLVTLHAPVQTAHAAPSSYLNFQGRLLNSSGNLVPDGFYNIEFKLFDAATSSGSSQGSCSGDANCKWVETYYDSNGVTAGQDNRLRVVNGYFSVKLGSLTAFSGINWDQQMWLTMNIGGSTQTATPTYDGEMTPRIQLTAVPLAFVANNVNSGSTNSASTNSNNVSIQSGNAAGTTSNSGNITIDAGTATGTTGTISLGATNQSGLILGRAGATTAINGSTLSLTAASTLSLTGTTTITGLTSGDALTVSNSTSSGNIFVAKDNTTTVMALADGGAATFTNSTNSTTAFQIQNSSGSPLFNVDTTSTSNLITNGSFEANTTGWTAKTGATLSRITTHQADGNAAMQVATTTSANSGVQFNFALAANTTYTFSFMAKLTTGSMSTMQFGYSNTGTDVSCSTGNTVNTDWQWEYCTFTTAGSVSGTRYVYVKQTDAGTARNIVIDQAQLTQTAGTVAYNNGGTLQLLTALSSPLNIMTTQDSQAALFISDSTGDTALAYSTVDGALSIYSGADGILAGNTSAGSFGLYLSSTAAEGFKVEQSGTSLDIFTVRTGGGNEGVDAYQLTVANGTLLNGDVDLGNAAADLLFFNGTIQGGSPFVFEGATADAFETTFAITNPSGSDKTITFPNETGTVCTTAAAGACSVAGGYVQLQSATPGTQQTGNFNISGKGILGTGLAVTGGTIDLNVSSSNATNINTGSGSGNVGILNGTGTGTIGIGNSAAGAITIQSGSTIGLTGTSTHTGLSSGSATALTVNNSTSTGSIFVAQDNGTPVFTIADGGAVTLTQLLTAQLGATISGAAINLNVSSSNATNINTGSGSGNVGILNGTGTGTVGIGNSASGAITLQGAALATALQVLDAGSAAFLTANTLTRSAGVTGNVLKVGDSTGTDTGVTLFQLDNVAGVPSTLTLANYNGSLFYDSTALRVKVIENGIIKTLCNQTDGSCGGNSTTLQQAYDASTGSTTPEIILDSTRNGIDIQDASAGTIGSTQGLLSVRGVGTSSTLGASLFVVNASGQVGINNGGTTATPSLNFDLSFGSGANRTIGIEANSSNAAGKALSVTAGAAGAGASPFAGGLLTLQGGAAAGTGNANGGNVKILGGNGVGTGVPGIVEIDTPVFTAVTNSTCGTSCTLTQANIDGNSTVVVEATAPGLTITVPSPTNTTTGRIVYIAASAASNVFTLAAGSPNISMRPNSTATLLWNGTVWTAAGADASTSLQQVYDNTSTTVASITTTSAAKTILFKSGSGYDTANLLQVQNSVGTSILNVGTASSNQNLIGNSNFEGGVLPWVRYTNPTAAVETTFAVTTSGTQSGTQALQVTTSAGAQDQGAKFYYPFKPNTSYAFSVYTSLSTNGGTAYAIGANYAGSDVTCSGNGNGLTFTTTVTRWTCTFTTSSSVSTNADYVFVRRALSDANVRTIYIDAVQLEAAAAATTYTDSAYQNLISNANAESAIDGWSAAGTGASVSLSDNFSYTGNRSIKFVTGTQSGGNQGVARLAYVFQPNARYTFTFWGRKDTGSSVSNINIGRADTADTELTTGCTTGNNFSTTWTQYSCTFTTGSTIGGTIDSYLFIKQTSGSTSVNLYLDAITLIAGGLAVSYTPPAAVLHVDGLNNNVTINNGYTGDLQPWQLSSKKLPKRDTDASTTNYNGYIYTVGGFDGSPNPSVYYAKLNANGDIGAWAANSYELGCSTPGCASSAATSAVVTMAAAGYIYAFGGSDSGGTAMTKSYYARLNSDGSTGPWLTAPALPAARTGASGFYYNGYAYVMGGAVSNSEQSTVYYAKVNADGTLGGWATTTPLTSARQNHVALTANGYAYVMGGCATACGASLNTVLYGKINTDGTIPSWTSTTAMPDVRDTGAGAVLNGYIYFIGGADTNGFRDGEVFFAKLNPDGSVGSWNISANNLPQGRNRVGYTTANGYVYLVGGKTTTSNENDTILFASGPRLMVNASLDLVGLSGQSLNEGGSGGTLTAGNTTIVGTFDVRGQSNFMQGVSIGGSLNVGGDTTIQTAINSQKAFQLQNQTGNNIVSISTVSANQNLIANPNFEANFAGWTKYQGTVETLALEGTIGIQSGTQSFKVTTTVAGSIQGTKYFYNLRANTTYTFSAYVSLGANGGTAYAFGANANGSDLSCTSGNGGTGLTFTTTITRYTCTFTTTTVTPGSDFLFVRRAASDTTVRNIYIDAAQLEYGTGATAFVDTPLSNLISNPSAESNANGWAVRNAGGTPTVTSSDDYALFGSRSIKVVTSTTANNGVYVYFDFEPSTRYSVSFWARKDTGSSQFTLSSQSVSGTDVTCTSSPSISASNSVTTAWTQFTCTFTTGGTITPPANVSIRQTDTTSDNLYIDGMTLVKGGVAQSYVQPANSLQVEPVYSNINLNAGYTGEIQPWNTNPTSLNTAVEVYGATVANGYVYIVAGQTFSVADRTFTQYAKINSDGSLGTWTTDPIVLPFTNSHLTSVFANGYLYSIGGYDGTNSRDTVYYTKLNANGSLNAWQLSPNRLPFGTGFHGSVVLNGYVYVLGGSEGSNNHADVYEAKLNADGTTGKWVQTTALGGNRANPAVATANGYIYVIGGTDAVFASRNNTVYYGRPNTDGTVSVWNTTTTFPVSMHLATATVVNGYIYVTGGGAAAGDLATTYLTRLNSDGTVGAWQQSANNLPESRTGTTSVSANGYFYIIGGGGPSATKGNVYYTSTARTQIAGSLDLVGFGGQTLSDVGSAGQLTAGNTTIVGTLDTRGSATFTQSVGIGGTLSVGGDVAIQSTTNSQNAFQVLNQTGNALVSISTISANQNLIANPNFEANTVGWAKNSVAAAETTFATDATNPQSGTQSLKVITSASNTGNNANQGARYIYQFKPNTSYVFTIYASLSTSSTSNFSVGANVNGSDVSCTVSGNGLTLNTTITRYTCAFTTGGTTTGSDYVFARRQEAVARTMYFDAAQLEYGTASTNFIDAPATNLIGNASGENNANGWSARVIGTSPTVKSVDTYSLYGSKSIELVTSTTTNNAAIYSYPFTASTRYSLSFWARIASGSAITNIAVGHNPAPTSFTTATGDTDCTTTPSISISTTWTQFTCTISVGSSVGPRGYIYIRGTNTTSRTVYIDGVTMVAGAVPQAYIASGSVLSIDPSGGGTVSILAGNNGEIGPWQRSPSILATATSPFYGGASANGYMYVVGGALTGTTSTNVVNYAKLNADGSVGAWNTTTVLPANRAGAKVFTSNGYIYVLGGVTNPSGGTTGQTTSYYAKLNPDGTVGTWNTTTVLPHNMTSFGGGAANGYAYIIGGWDGSSGYWTDTYYAKIAANGALGSWTAGTVLGTSSADQSVLISNNNIYVVGGGTGGGYSSVVQYATLNPTTGALGSWVAATSLPVARHSADSAAIVNGYLYVIGGYENNIAVNTIYYAKVNGDGSLGSWAVSNTQLPAGHAASAVTTSNGYVYLAGGDDGTTINSDVIYARFGSTLQVGGNLDLVGSQGQGQTDGGGANGSTGGSLTAGNGVFVGSLEVRGNATFSQSLNVADSLTVMGTAGFNGSLIATGSATTTTGTTSGTGGANVTSITLASAGSFANNDIIFVDNTGGSGQDYYTRIVSGGGSTTLTISPAVSYGTAAGFTGNANITKYNAQNIGATTTDYSTLNNRFFQGYFLGGIVTGAGSTVYADQNITTTGNLTIGTSDTTGTLLILDTKTGSGDPTEVDGGMYYNSNMKAFRCGLNGVWVSCLGGLLSANTSVPGGNTVASTATETAFASTYAIPANACQPGKVYRVTATGTYNTAAGGTAKNLQLKMKVVGGATVTLGDTGLISSMSDSLSGQEWHLNFTMICYTAGASGTVEAQGRVDVTDSSPGTSGMANTGTVTIDTTVAQTFTLTAKWAASSASNSITLRQFIVEGLGP